MRTIIQYHSKQRRRRFKDSVAIQMRLYVTQSLKVIKKGPLASRKTSRYSVLSSSPESLCGVAAGGSVNGMLPAQHLTAAFQGSSRP